jgi:Ca2+-binding EF-hand superfamily protein
MEIAMADGESGGDGDDERSLSTRSLIDRKRQDVVHQKKGKRMDDYLQQKRREMNNNIGAVFKRTSFATVAAASDASSSTSHSGKAKKKHLKGTAAAPDAAVDPRAALEAHAQVEKSRVFGIYGVQEVMSVIRLFWSMDDDGSGTLSLAELIAYRAYFEKLGYHDMATVFQAVDRDRSGSISLKELLSICFQYATKFQIDEMLKLAKLGDVASYFDTTRSQRRLNPNNGETARDGEKGRTSKTSLDARSMEVRLSPEQRAELLAIFRVFDRNGDGGIAMDEILEALHVGEDDTLARIAAVEEAQLAKRDAASPGMKRRPSMAVPTTAASQRSTASAFTKEEVRRMYESVDSDGDQSLSFEEFLVLMQMLHAPRR